MELIDESVTYQNDRLAGQSVVPRKRKTEMAKGSHRKQVDENGNVVHEKPVAKPGTVRGELKKDGTPRKKPVILTGTKRGKYTKDGKLRKKPRQSRNRQRNSAIDGFISPEITEFNV